MTKAPSATRRKSIVTNVLPQTSDAPSPPQRSELDLHIPLSSRAIFWRPRYMAASPSLELVPSLFWLIESQRPSRIVQLGLGDGLAYMALCQAVDKLGLEASSAGVTLTGEDDRAEEEPKPRHPIAALHDVDYREFSVLLEGSPVAMAERLTGRPIDLLVLNTPLTAELVACLNEYWLPHLSARGVVVVMDPHEIAKGSEARRLLEHKLAKAPNVLCEQGESSLLLSLLGPSQPERLRRLATLEPNEPGFLAAMQVFRRLGNSLSHEWQTIELNDRLARALEEVADLKTKTRNLNASWAKSREEAQVALQGERQLSIELAKFQVRAFDAEQALMQQRDEARVWQMQSQNAQEAEAAARQETEQLKAQLASEREATAELRQSLEASTQKAKALAADLATRSKAEIELAKLQTEYDARLEDIVALSAKQRNLEARLSEENGKGSKDSKDSKATEAQLKSLAYRLNHAENKVTKRDGIIATQKARIQELEKMHRSRIDDIVALTTPQKAQLEQMQARIDAMLSSTSWKVTKPLRGIGDTLRRKPRS